MHEMNSILMWSYVVVRSTKQVYNFLLEASNLSELFDDICHHCSPCQNENQTGNAGADFPKTMTA